MAAAVLEWMLTMIKISYETQLASEIQIQQEKGQYIVFQEIYHVNHFIIGVWWLSGRYRALDWRLRG